MTTVCWILGVALLHQSLAQAVLVARVNAWLDALDEAV